MAYGVTEAPVGQAAPAGINGDVFGRRGNRFHPYLSVLGIYSDNIFSTRINRLSDYTLIVSPGFWFASPGSKERILAINTSSVTPGGLMLSRYKGEIPRRFQSYLLYGADIERFREFAKLDAVSHTLEGFAQYNFRSGLSVDLVDKFKASQDGGVSVDFTDQHLTSLDDRGLLVIADLQEYTTNLLSASTAYDPHEKLTLRLDLSNFVVDYRDAEANFRDRVDWTWSGYGEFKFKPKTSFFLEYDFLDVRYRAGGLNDSREHNFFAGLRWDMTAKSKGRLKAGAGVKDFTKREGSDSDNWLFELHLEHNFSEKRWVKMIILRMVNESTAAEQDYTLTSRINGYYNHRLTAKLLARLNFSYTHQTYVTSSPAGQATADLEDDIYTVAPMVEYTIRDWLTSEVSYVNVRRYSLREELDYVNNIGFLRFTAAF